MIGFCIVAALILISASVTFYHSLKLSHRDRTSKEKLCEILFPQGEEQRNAILSEMEEFTQDKYSRNDLLDYYLKIKGLQIIDLHANGDVGIRHYLLQPTQVKFNFYEKVKFYEKYLNYPQATGINAVGTTHRQKE